ncbi:YceI family protein [Paenalcaligenes niemegkensis]|uniref:YceI family protein n=1 Tax=Paenalcaligenes niemegkensis TaxID=2895469 RepID=UPI001EE8C5D7|nr:YceI family protein [Paenalcaligenes niemegkensis]MCQ9616312.1 YceI family protein [Paenalcaligenes niemegkensis]
MNKNLIASLVLSALSFTSLAANYTSFVENESEVKFAYKQMGVSLDGEFSEFNGSLSFDTEKPESAHATITVPLASIDTGSDEGNEEVAGKSWFNINDFPVASFETTRIQANDDQTFLVTGNLNIKGTSKEIEFPATFNENGNKGTFKGEFIIQRGDYAVGEGSWAKYDIVANDVTIAFSLTATSN